VALKSLAYNLFSRLYERFNLEPRPVEQIEQPSVANQIVPVTQADRLLQVLAPQSDTADISAAAGTLVVYFTVPAGRRWTIISSLKEATTANTRIRATIGGTAMDIGPFGTAESVIVNSEWILDQGDDIGLLTTGNAGDSNRRLVLQVLEERSF